MNIKLNPGIKRHLRRFKIFVVHPLRIRFFPPRSLNFHIYDEIRRQSLPRPDIEMRTPEQYSQCGEDIIVLSILKAFALKNRVDISKFYFCEFGANHPVSTSSTYLLAKVLKMKGLLVEANPQLVPDLIRTRPEAIVVNSAVSNQNLDEVTFYLSNHSEISSLSQSHVQKWREGEIGQKNVIRCPAIRYNDLIERYLKGVRPLFVAVDIEGHDLEVLVDMNLDKYGPLVLQIEAGDDFDSGPVKKMIDYLESHGYSVLAKTKVNLIARKNDASDWLQQTNDR